MSNLIRTSSNYISVNKQELLIEFEYNSFTLTTEDLGFLRVTNRHNKSINYMNFHPLYINRATNKTGNSFDRSAQQLTDSEWVKFDFEKPIGHFEAYNPGLHFDNLSDINLENQITYHTAKLHILEGYNLEDLEGIILRVSYKDTAGNIAYVGNIVFDKTYSPELSSDGFKIGDRTFDKFIRVSIPDLNDLINIESQMDDSIKQRDISDGIPPFPDPKNSKINIEYLEIGKIETDTHGQDILKSATLIGDNNGTFSSEIDTSDLFADIAAIIRESGNGDFFEIFPTYNGQFLEDYFADKSRNYNNRFIVFHDLELDEHSFNFSVDQSYSKQTTYTSTQMQDTNFNDSIRYRPVILNDDTKAFTIKYTVRILDKTDNFFIIKKATYTYQDASKYSRYLNKININEQNQIKIVNKIVTQATDNKMTMRDNPYMLANTSDFYSKTTGGNGSIIPIQYHKIFMTGSTYLATNTVNKTGLIEQIAIEEINENSQIDDFRLYTDDLLYGQGDLTIYINPYDNFLKFSSFTLNGKNITAYNITENNDSRFFLIFRGEKNEEIRIPQFEEDLTIKDARIDVNDLFFKISSEESSKILQSEGNTFDIVMVRGSEENKEFEVLIYNGIFENVKDYRYREDFSVNKILKIK